MRILPTLAGSGSRILARRRDLGMFSLAPFVSWDRRTYSVAQTLAWQIIILVARTTPLRSLPFVSERAGASANFVNRLWQ